MRTEALLFAGDSVFFLVTDLSYAWFATDPAGTAALTVAWVMSALIAFFFATQHHRKGLRPEDRAGAEVLERAGPLDFFPPHSGYPSLAALGFALLAVGVVFGLWLFLIGLGLLTTGVLGFVFEFVGDTA